MGKGSRQAGRGPVPAAVPKLPPSHSGDEPQLGQLSPCSLCHHGWGLTEPRSSVLCRDEGAHTRGAVQAWGTAAGSVGSSRFHSRADESLDKNAAQF